MSNNNKNQINRSRYEVILVGDAFCGKSSYLKSIIDNKKSKEEIVLITDNQNEIEFVVQLNNQIAIFNLKDTANQERFKSLTQGYYHKTESVLLVFDMSNEESFFNLTKWYTDIQSYCNTNDSNFAVVLIGMRNKLNAFNVNRNWVDAEMIRKFKEENSLIIGFSEVDLNDNRNLMEPLEILFNHFIKQSKLRRSSQAILSDKAPGKYTITKNVNGSKIQDISARKRQNKKMNKNECCNLI